jgi:hypothetical protein
VVVAGYHDPLDTLTLSVEGGDVVPTTRTATEPVGELSSVTLSADEPLVLGTTYAVMGADSVIGTFTVGAAADEEAPAPVAILGVDRVVSQSIWGATKGIELTLPEPAPGTFFEVEVTRASGLVLAFPIEFGPAFVGQGLCTNSADFESGEELGLALQAVDLAGNRSGWTVFDGEARAPGCSQAGGPVGMMWAAALLVVGRRRALSPRTPR